MPTEDEFMDFFKHLRNELGMSSSTLWTNYSMVNSFVKGKYGKSLQTMPRITSLIKSFDTDIKNKAFIFSKDEIACFVSNKSISGPYWLVRKVVVIMAYFGGLRSIELMNLKLEMLSSDMNGVHVKHMRSKQRSDKQNAKFLISRSTDKDSVDYAGVVESYIHQVHDNLDKFTGILFSSVSMAICLSKCLSVL